MIYYLQPGESTIGADAKNTISMQGLGMIPTQAKFKVSKDLDSLIITPIAPDNGKVTVNGNIIKG